MKMTNKPDLNEKLQQTISEKELATFWKENEYALLHIEKNQKTAVIAATAIANFGKECAKNPDNHINISKCIKDAAASPAKIDFSKDIIEMPEGFHKGHFVLGLTKKHHQNVVNDLIQRTR